MSDSTATAAVASQTLLLDSDIRDWVVLPLFFIMVAAGLLRVQVGNLLKAAPKKHVSDLPPRTQSTIRFTSQIKTGAANFVSTSAFEARATSAYPKLLQSQAEYCEHAIELKKKKADRAQGEEGGDDEDMPNPLAALDGMKGNMAFMVQNMVMMQAIQHFFSGFILLKIPFSLTNGFKQMFQRGLDLQSLDTSYVSSVSWYFLVMFGLRGFFRLVIGSPSQETIETQNLHKKFGYGASAGGGPPGGPSTEDDDAQASKLTTEADNMDIQIPQNFVSQLDSVEKRLLQNKYPKKKVTIGGGSDFLMGQSQSQQSNSKGGKKSASVKKKNK